MNRLEISSPFASLQGCVAELKKGEEFLKNVRLFELWVSRLPLPATIEALLQQGGRTLKLMAQPFCMPILFASGLRLLREGRNVRKKKQLTRRFVKQLFHFTAAGCKTLVWINRVNPLDPLQLSKEALKTTAKVGAVARLAWSGINLYDSLDKVLQLEKQTPYTKKAERALKQKKILAAIGVISAWIGVIASIAIVCSIFFCITPPLLLSVLPVIAFLVNQIFHFYFNDTATSPFFELFQWKKTYDNSSKYHFYPSQRSGCLF